MKRISFLLLFSGVLLTFSSRIGLAQTPESPTTMAVGFWHCDSDALDELVEFERERWLPIAQELVNEGRIIAFGQLRHEWGDEWNLVEWTTATDLDAATDANGEMRRRFSERYPGDNFFYEHCREHHDNIYTLRSMAGTSPVVDPANPPTVSLSFWKCPPSELRRLVALEDSLSMPIARALADEGRFRNVVWLTHEWGDEWNLVRWSSAADIPTLLATFDEQDKRFDERHPNPPPDMRASCSAHKDNLYTLVHRTAPQKPVQSSMSN